ncbi:MAG: hypothetical protein L3J98_09305 [Gammaproteobacteria bacterium]|nr:hypothetical protein [Gammaproteobacteria bacterium]MCF6260338.1 hypothetical protein [Gammaproteobacteria bacterium]
MMKNLNLYLLTLLLMNISATALAVPLNNGDFSSGLANWNDASFTGSVSEVDGVAILETTSGVAPLSAVLVQGDNGFFSFFSPITLGSMINYLNFDVAFRDIGIDETESGGSIFTDELMIVLYDEFDPFMDLDFSVGINAILSPDTVRFNLDVSSLAGRSVALSFELNDENDRRNSQATIDNVSFTVQPDSKPPAMAVSEPMTLYLFFLGLVFMLIRSFMKHRYTMYAFKN